MKEIRLWLAVTVLFYIAYDASAQLGLKSLLNKTADAVAPAVKAAPSVNTASAPWPLRTKYESWDHDNAIYKYVKDLGKEKKEDVLELDKQLRARIKTDRAIVAADGPGKEEAEEEIERYEDFLFALSNPVRMNCDIKIDVEKKKMEFNSFKVFFSNFSSDVAYSKKDGKYYFYGANGEPEYIREKELPYAQEAYMQMYFINVFLANQDKDEYLQIQSKAAVSANNTQQAIKNNSPDVVIFHPIRQFPKGELHDEYAKEALKLALEVFPNAVDVIINSNDWGIARNKLGIIIRRDCAGWVVVKDDIGKRVIPTKWTQPNQGGDTYGKLQILNYGGNQRFYVKDAD